MDPEDCPWREKHYEHYIGGESRRSYHCTAAENGEAILGATEEQALEQFCMTCEVPKRYDELPDHVEPQILFFLGGGRAYMWRCTVCGKYAEDLASLEDCHD